jgi:hypothetical protein
MPAKKRSKIRRSPPERAGVNPALQIPLEQAETGCMPLGAILDQIEYIEVNAFMNGAPMTIRFFSGTNPMEVRAMLVALDPNADIKAAFNRGGWNAREIKSAIVTVIAVRTTEQWRFVDFLAQDETSISVPNRMVDNLVSALKVAISLRQNRVEKLTALLSSKSTGSLMLTSDEFFEVEYSGNEDGKFYLERIVKQPKPQPGG